MNQCPERKSKMKKVCLIHFKLSLKLLHYIYLNIFGFLSDGWANQAICRCHLGSAKIVMEIVIVDNGNSCKFLR